MGSRCHHQVGTAPLVVLGRNVVMMNGVTVSINVLCSLRRIHELAPSQ